MAVRSPFPDINIPEVSLAEFILNEAKCFSDRIAFIDDATGRTMTFTEFNDDVNKLAKGLHAIGLEKNDVIALCLPNMIEYIVVTYGVLLAGGITAGVNTSTVLGMKKIFSNANPRYIFALPDMLETVKNASSSCSSVQEIFIVERNIDGDKSYDELLRLGKDQVLPAIEIVPKDDAAMLVYTSGSTGDRKAAVNTHRNLVANTLQISYPRISPFSGNDVSIALRPMSHGYGLSMYLTSGLYNGCRLIFLEDYGTESLMKAIDKYKVTLLTLTPLNLAQLSKFPDASNYDVSSVKTVFSAGAPLSHPIMEKFKAVFKTNDIRDTFGMTEVMFTFIPENNKPHIGVGIPLPNVEIKILDLNTGKPLGVGSKGELWIKSPSLCKGYKDKPEETKASFFDGWLKTGDAAYFDDNINIFIIDRIKEFIFYDTTKVAPRELEDIIQDLPGVDSVVVVGVPDEEYQELAKAFVIKQPGSSLTEDDVIKVVQESLERKRWLHGGVEFVETLPKTPSGKVLRRLVKENLVMKKKKGN